MEFKKEKKRRVEIESDLSVKYPHDLHMYTNPPDVQISLCEFEELAIERLKVLRILELVAQKGTKSFDEFKTAVVDELNRQGLKLYRKLVTASGTDATDEKARQEGYEARQRDHISHFILRFPYCQSEEYRRWFISRELELFKLRWSYLSAEGKRAFFKFNNLNIPQVDADTLRDVSESSGGFISTSIDYSCVKWTDVLDLVRQRKVFLERGRAYIPSGDLISVIGATFRSNLSHTLGVMSHKLPIIEEDERLKRLMKNLHHTYTGKSYVASDGNKCVSLQSIDSLAKSSFPLCMRQMYNALKTQHHLKHWARQQFGLFLKGIGLTLEDALIFWRTEFTKKPEIDLDQFEKKYAYNVRYNYGKEGKRTNYTPYSCVKIITSTPGPGEYHGCPFKYNDVQSLRQTFAAQNFSDRDINEILHYKNSNQYQLACGKYYELIHKVPIMSGINHPNQYFDESQKIFAATDVQTPRNVAKPSTSAETKTKTSEELLNDSEFDGMDLDLLPGL